MIDDTALRRRLARVLKRTMQAQRLTGLELANKVGIAQSTVSRILEGNQTPSLTILLALLAGLGLSLGWLHEAGITPPAMAKRCTVCEELRSESVRWCEKCPGAGFKWVPWFGI
jgi:transcriptional regulator with XRE-family HTH domain